MGAELIFPWAAFGALATATATIAALTVHIVKYGEEKGAMRERVKRLEDEMVEQKEIRDSVIKLTGTVERLNDTVDDFKDLLKTIMTNQNIPPWHISGK